MQILKYIFIGFADIFNVVVCGGKQGEFDISGIINITL